MAIFNSFLYVYQRVMEYDSDKLDLSIITDSVRYAKWVLINVSEEDGNGS